MTGKCPIEFLDAYITCALWSSTDDKGEPLDSSFTRDDIADETLQAMWADCDSFYEANADSISDRDDQAGHDFWLTRCGHGAGFWDGDWPEASADALTAAAKTFGNVDLYVGDDGKIYA